MRKLMRKLFLYSIISLLLSATVWSQQEKAALVINPQIRKQIIENIILELQAKYVLPEKVKDIEIALRTKHQDGGYEKMETPSQFANALTQDLRTAGSDLHLFVAHDPTLEKALIASPPAPSVKLQELPPSAERLVEMRESNYDFHKLELLRGNVGYLDLRSFVDLDYSKNTAVAAMGFLANTDAVIIDLRKNPGGFVNLNTFLASYFFGVERVELLSRYHRDTNVTVKDSTLPKLPGKRMPQTDLYILTSKNTGSSAERFAFIMQQRKRAKIIGETTSGAGYGNKEFPIGNGFVFYVSIFRQFDSKTGRGWQDVGVKPDISIPAEKALSAAHLEAIKNLSIKATGERKKQQLSWLAPLLDFEMNGAKQVSQSLLEKYAGNYTPRITVTLEQGQLYFLGASGIKRKLFALSNDDFLMDDASVSSENQARVRFVRNPESIVSELQLMVADGRKFPRAREVK